MTPEEQIALLTKQVEDLKDMVSTLVITNPPGGYRDVFGGGVPDHSPDRPGDVVVADEVDLRLHGARPFHVDYLEAFMEGKIRGDWYRLFQADTIWWELRVQRTQEESLLALPSDIIDELNGFGIAGAPVVADYQGEPSIWFPDSAVPRMKHSLVNIMADSRRKRVINNYQIAMLKAGIPVANISPGFPPAQDPEKLLERGKVTREEGVSMVFGKYRNHHLMKTTLAWPALMEPIS